MKKLFLKEERSCLFGVFIFLFLKSYSVDASYVFDYGERYFHTVATKPELPSDVVTALAQDKNGFIWIGSLYGLLRFDGYKFNLYQHEEGNPNSLSGNLIDHLIVDSNNRVWIATRSDGVTVYDSSNNRFTRILHQEKATNSLRHNSVRMLKEDFEGNIWVGTLNGINVVDKKSFQVTSIDNISGCENIYNNARAESLLIDNDKKVLWIGTSLGLCQINIPANNEEISSLRGKEIISGIFVHRIEQDHEGTIWLGTRKNGIYKVNPQTLISSKIDISFNLSKNTPPIIMDFLPVSSDRMWIATYGEGILIINPKTGGVMERIKHSRLISSSINYNQVSELLLDRNGLIWIATWGGGLNLYDPGNEGIRSIQVNPNTSNTLDLLDIRSLLETSDGQILFGTPGNGIKGFGPNIDNYDRLFDLDEGRVVSINEDNNGDIWIGTVSKGLFRFDKQAGELISVEKSLGTISVIKDFFGQIWVGTSTGLYSLDTDTLLKIKLNDYLGIEKIAGERVQSIIELNNELWLGTDQGLFVLNTLEKTLTQIHSTSDAHEQNTDNRITGLLVTRDKALIVGTAHGIHKLVLWDGEHAKFERLDDIVGREPSHSANLLEDEQGRIWSHKGYIDIRNKSFRNFEMRDGWDVGSIWRESYTKSRDGTLLYGGSKGILLIRPELFVETKYKAPIVITEIVVGDKKISAPEDGVVSIEHNKNFVSVEFSLLDYSNPLLTNYKFRLKGYDSGWKISDVSDRHATYTNLPVGHYKLEIRASNRFGIESDTLSMDIIRIPAWYETYAFKIAVFICFMGMLYLIFKWRLQKVENQRDKLNYLVGQRTEELASAKLKAEEATNAKSDFLAKMSHEIRTPMNAVIGLSQLTLRTPLQKDQEDNLFKILDSSQALLGLINDILDFSKIEAGKMDIEKTPFTLDSVIQRAVGVVSLKAHEKNLEVITYISPDVPNHLIGDPLRIQQIITNLCTNAVKFTDSGTVSVIVERLSDDVSVKLKVSVRDTGMGMTEEQQAKLFSSFAQADDSITRKYGGTGLGLAICKQLSELMSGEIWVDSALGEGSTFCFTIIVDENPVVTEKPRISREVLSKLKVLVVDDVELSRVVVCEALSSTSIKADTADNGKEAIDKIRQAVKEDSPYDLVIMDWKMPVMDGIEAAKVISNELKQDMPQILMVSAYDKSEIKSLASPIGIHHFLEKPVNQSLLIDYLIGIVTGRAVEDVSDCKEIQIPDLSDKRLLLVEDNKLNQQVALGFLQDTKASVDIAENGQLAIDILDEHHQYDLILMDVQMPVMDGLTAAKILREEKHIPIPIIAMTAHAMAGDSEKSKAAGMNDHLTKPIEPSVLYAMLGQYLGANSQSLKLTEHQNAQLSELVQSASQLTELNVEDALSNMRGNQKLFEDLLNTFANANMQLLEKVESLIESQHQDELFRLMHTLKATSSYIGAEDIANRAAVLEHEIGANQIDGKAIRLLCERTQFLAETLKAMIVIDEQDITPQELDTDKVKGLIKELVPLVDGSNARAEDLAKELVKYCRGTELQDAANEILENLEDIEFEEALTKLQMLSEKIE